MNENFGPEITLKETSLLIDALNVKEKEFKRHGLYCVATRVNEIKKTILGFINIANNLNNEALRIIAKNKKETEDLEKKRMAKEARDAERNKAKDIRREARNLIILENRERVRLKNKERSGKTLSAADKDRLKTLLEIKRKREEIKKPILEILNKSEIIRSAGGVVNYDDELSGAFIIPTSRNGSDRGHGSFATSNNGRSFYD